MDLFIAILAGAIFLLVMALFTFVLTSVCATFMILIGGEVKRAEFFSIYKLFLILLILYSLLSKLFQYP